MIRSLALAFLIALLAATALSAQRNEVALQFGGTLTQRRSIDLPSELQSLIGTATLRENNGYAGGLVYRVRLADLGPVALMAEVPVFVVQATNTDLIPLVARPIFGNTSGASAYITPGAVVRFLREARLSPYAFVGAGYARVVEAQVISIERLQAGFTNQGTWAVNYGGGADLRLLGFLAVRGELRNFYTGATDVGIPLPQESRQRNTLLLTGGVVFRF